MRPSLNRCVLASAGCFALAGPAIAQPAPLAASARQTSVFIPYANATPNQTALTSLPTIAISLNGRAETFTLDSGSTGVVVSQDNFTPPAGQAPIGPGQIEYSSSGRVLTGEYYMTDVQYGSGAQSATARLPVLLALQEICTTQSPGCTPGVPTGVGMSGVGFGGMADALPNATPGKNPFLHISKIGGKPATPAPGYILTAAGVTLGITPQMARSFRQVKLVWDAPRHDWTRAPVTVDMAGWTATGIVLVDTGVEYMLVNPPMGQTVPTLSKAPKTSPCYQKTDCAAQGVTVGVQIGVVGAHYAFRVGKDGVPNARQIAAPAYVAVEPNTTTSNVFINTSYHFLNRFDYMYDYTFGIVGFRSALGKKVTGAAE